jgi:3-keto-5-aminohexanoate cleavage enzyme
MKALEKGGHVRVGYEDGPFLSSGKRARSNAELVEEVARAARSVGREVVAPDKARMIMGIK